VFRRRRRDTGGGPDSDVGQYESGDAGSADDEDAGAEYAAQEYAAEDEYGPEDDQAGDYDEDAGYSEPDDADADEAEYAAGDYPPDDGAPGFAADDGTEGASRPGRERADLGDPATWTRLRDSQSAEPAMARMAGPWDSASEFPDMPRIDFGSLLVPVRDGYDVQVLMSEEEGIAIAVVSGDGGLQLQPFAAPRSSGLWHEVLPEIAAEVAKAGGQSQEQNGPFGPELVATVVPQGTGESAVSPQPLRFIGVDGPRWFLRGLISGPAAADTQLAEPFRDIFADVVVVRGDHAEPPRKPLAIQLPDEARQVLENEATQQEANPFDPFERGPEITETR
jgi:Protein of unknown function (DUF3710)